MPLAPPYPATCNARARQHTWLTVGGGAALVPLLLGVLTVYAYRGPGQSGISVFSFWAGGTLMLIAIGILPALLFAFLREPIMRRLFNWISQLPNRGARAVALLVGTLLVFLSYATIGAVLFSVYMWLEGPSAQRLNYWQYLIQVEWMSKDIINAFAIFGTPWLLAALTSAWYVNRDLLPGVQYKADTAC